MTERSLAGKRVVVVGGSAGIGRAFALKALEDRARLVVVARRELPAEVLADAAQVTSVSADIRNPDDCRRIGETAASTLGQVDLLLISAGYAPLKAFSDVDAEDWSREIFDVELGTRGWSGRRHRGRHGERRCEEEGPHDCRRDEATSVNK